MSDHSTLIGTQLHDMFHYITSIDPGAVGADKNWLDISLYPAFIVKRRNITNTGWDVVSASIPAGGAVGQVLKKVSASDFDFSWQNEAVGGGLVLLSSQTASASASLDFTSVITATYDEYIIELIDIVPVTNSVDLFIRLSGDNGVTWDTAANYVNNHYLQATSGNISVVATVAQWCARNSPEISNDPNKAISGQLRLYRPLSASYKKISGQISWSGTANYVNSIMDCTYIQTAAMDAIQFFFSSGNIASGTIRMYGIAKV